METFKKKEGHSPCVLEMRRQCGIHVWDHKLQDGPLSHSQHMGPLKHTKILGGEVTMSHLFKSCFKCSVCLTFNFLVVWIGSSFLYVVIFSLSHTATHSS